MSDELEAAAPKRRKKAKALTPMSVKHLEARDYIVAKVEQRIPHCFITRDAFGIFDLLAASRGGGIVGVQVTSGSNGAARRDKILAEPRARIWLESGGRILLHLWAKRNDQTAGARKVYSLVEEEIVLDDFPLRRDEPPSPGRSQQQVELRDERVELGDGRAGGLD